MTRANVRHIPLIVRHAHNAPHHFRGALQGSPYLGDGHCDPLPFDVRALRG